MSANFFERPISPGPSHSARKYNRKQQPRHECKPLSPYSNRATVRRGPCIRKVPCPLSRRARDLRVAPVIVAARTPRCPGGTICRKVAGLCHGLVAHLVCERDKIEIVACRIASENQHAFDAENFRSGWNGQCRALMLERRRFQWLAANQLTHTRLNSIKAAEYAIPLGKYRGVF